MPNDRALVETPTQLESVNFPIADPQRPTSEIVEDSSSGDPHESTDTETSRDVLDGLRMVDGSIRELQAIVEKHHERSAAQEHLLQRLQGRVDDLQRDQVRTLLGPVYEQLASLHADLAEVADRHRAAHDPGSLGKELSYLVTRVDSALQLLGLESVAAAPGIAFDSRLHAATRLVPTGTTSLDRTIERVHRQGFSFPGAKKVSMHARVSVYEYDPALDRDRAPDLEPEPAAEPPAASTKGAAAGVPAADPPPNAPSSLPASSPGS